VSERNSWSVVTAEELDGLCSNDEGYAMYGLSQPLELRQLRANLFRFSPGDEMEYHNHDWQEELLYVVSGECTVVVEGERLTARAGDALRFGPQPRRRLFNESGSDCVWFAVGAPPVDEDWNVFEPDTPGDPPAPEGTWALARAGDLEEKTRDRYVITWLAEPLGLQHLRANLFRFRPGDRMHLHAHIAQEELFFIIDGDAELIVGEESRLVSAGDVVRVDREPARQLVHAGRAECLWLAVGAPPVDDDAVFAE
jgi:uncharacterized cupin superfamily protein